MLRAVLIASFIVATFAQSDDDDTPMPATCADAKAMPACTAALQAADTDCYGTVNTDCTTSPGPDEGTTCMTMNVKEGDKLDPADPAMTYNMVGSSCVNQAGCVVIKGYMSNIDITCADAATSCAVGNTCSAGSPMAADDDGPMPATCADAKALPACTAALQAADKKCYGPVNEDCTTATGTDTGSTCATVNLKAGDKLDPAEPAVTFDYAETNCVEPARCALMKAAMPTLDITCADAATTCGVGNTCSAGSMAQVSMSAVLFALCAALYQL